MIDDGCDCLHCTRLEKRWNLVRALLVLATIVLLIMKVMR